MGRFAGRTRIIGPPAAGENTENVHTHMAMPLCHRFAAPIFQAYVNRNLSWRWLSTNVSDVASADLALVAGCEELVNFIRVASTRRAGEGGGAVRDPLSKDKYSQSANDASYSG
jgi:hypothetical protein